MKNLYDLTRPELIDLIASLGFTPYHAGVVWRGLYRQQVTDLGEIKGLRADLREKLTAVAQLPQPSIRTSQQSSDGYTRKYLLAQSDGQAIETVIMRYEARRERAEETRRFTTCISTQAGCAMGCVFCATGQMGFARHLTAGEIVAQVLFVTRTLAQEGRSLRNIVLMGMGEPLHNYDNVMQALAILTDDTGVALAPRHITLSTVGLPHQIRRMADEARPYHLAVSLHGATDAERQALVPPAKKWPLAELLGACRYYAEKMGRRIFFEWTLIEGENDTAVQAHALGQLLQGIPAHVNVIPLNPTAGYAGLPSRPERVQAFQAILREYGLPSTVRQRRGIDIAAGCGQLAGMPS
jgi:23S rRNA (adenine2503-C2)-methyltransferase